ncbi:MULTISPECIES: hypothetical protein [unclassified Kitasatospora]|uniref:hypothetical protein n=1 Tax=unclassified Kitasatospora TaxID=2633591 RepID=UPI0033C11415
MSGRYRGAGAARAVMLVADWITELLPGETQSLASGGRATGQLDDGQDAGVELAWW